MVLTGSRQINQKASAHSARATGRASRKPRAKLGQRADCSIGLKTSGEAEVPFGLLALFIMISDLLPLDSKKQALSTDVMLRTTGSRGCMSGNFGINHSSNNPLAAHRSRPARSALISEFRDAFYILWLLAAPGGAKAPKARRVIAAGSRRCARRRNRWPLRLAGSLSLALLGPRVATAQPAEVLTPIEMFDPDSGDGVRIAPGFILYPQATTEFTYDTNIFNRQDNEIDDVFVSVRPSLVLASDFARHGLRFEAGGEIRRYFDIQDENSEQYRVRGSALLELGNAIDFESYAGFSRGIERRGTAGDAFLSDQPVVFHDKTAGFELSRAGTKLRLSAAADVLKRDYQDTSLGGVPIDLEFRDVKILTGRMRADLGVSDKTELFVELGANDIDYEISTTPRRDSHGYSALVGVTHELSALVEVEAGVGYIRQEFDEPGLSPANEFNYRFSASWTPKPVWRLTASATRSVDPSRVQESPAIIASEFKLEVQRAVGDRLLLGAEAGYLEESYRASPRQDKLAFVSGSAIYRLTDQVGVFASAGYRDQSGGNFGRSYDGFAASIGVRASW